MIRHKTSARPAIGIDLGTWKCCVGVVREGKVEIIENERGSKTTPSYVAFTETKRLVGEDAKDQVALNPTNTVFGVKRIIGRRFDYPLVKTHLGNFPFNFKQVCGSERTEIRVQYRQESKWLPPEHLTAMLLRKMKLTAEAHLGCPVLEAVVSVPVCFNSGQRQATLDAAEIAGLKVLQLLHEPTAVALAYKDQAGRGALNQTVMVVDAGGGTLQAAVASIKDGLVDVKAVSGNAQFGGCDLDQFLVNECSKRLRFTQNVDISKNKKGMERLRVVCHKAKCDLTLLPQTIIKVDSLVKDTDFETAIHREEFNKLFRELSDKLITEVVKDALKGAHLNVDQIDKVLVVGGSSQIPAIITQLEGLFPGKKMDMCVNMNEAVAHGAALQAALLAGDHTVAYTSLSDVTCRDFYLEQASNRTERRIIFGKNCTIPLEKILEVSRGVRGKQTLNFLEGDFVLKPIKSYELQFINSVNSLREGMVLIKIDRNGLLSELRAPFRQFDSIRVRKSYYGISDMQPHIRVEKSFQSDEENEAMRLQASMKLEYTCIEIKSAVEGFQNGNGGQTFMKTYGKKCSGLLTSCNEYIDWLDNNPYVSIMKSTSKNAELEERFENLSVAFNSAICIKLEGNETTQNTMKPARQSEDRTQKENISNSILATEEHFLSVPGITQSQFLQASDASAMHSGGIKHAVANNPPETEMAQFDLRNKQIDAQNERSASPSTSSRSDQEQLVDVTKRDEYSRFTELNLPSPDVEYSNSLTSAKTLLSMTRKSSVTGSFLAFPEDGAASQINQLVCAPRASRSSSECDATSEDKTPLDFVRDRKSVVLKQARFRSPKPETGISNQSSVLLTDAKSAKWSEGSLDTSATNSKDKRGGEQGCEECNSTTFFKQDPEASHKLLVSEKGSAAKHAIRDNRQTTYSRIPETVNTETSGSSNQAKSIEQYTEERHCTTSNGYFTSPSTSASDFVASPSTTISCSFKQPWKSLGKRGSDFVTGPSTTASSSVPSHSTLASVSVTNSSTLASGSVTSPSTIASGSVASLSTATSGSVTSPSTTASCSVTCPSLTAGSSVTSFRTTDCKQVSDNSKSQSTISSI